MKKLLFFVFVLFGAFSAQAQSSVRKFYLADAKLDPQFGILAKKWNNGVLSIGDTKVKMEVSYRCISSRCPKIAVQPILVDLEIVEYRKGSCSDRIVAREDMRPVDGMMKELVITDYSQNSKCLIKVDHLVKVEYNTAWVDRFSSKTMTTKSVLQFDPVLPK